MYDTPSPVQLGEICQVLRMNDPIHVRNTNDQLILSLCDEKVSQILMSWRNRENVSDWVKAAFTLSASLPSLVQPERAKVD